ncbi:large subunit ribosomal protein L2 [Vigna unguiculata]|uniref:Small ribosomal subunit protein uS3c n=25 Tax=fabids TaxID=91835 RepID=A0A4D6NME4_VIGUN|nr:large subunit ribosomal protein L2 [Vigna unguiculata]
MAIHLYKTSTPSTRNGAVDSQVKSNPRNNLIYGQHRCGKGRNARGIITAGHRGGGHKRLYRKIDFRRNEKDIYGRIVTIEYDPNRNAYICLIHYGDGEKRYILHPRGAIIGDTIVSGTEVPIKMGNALPLSAISSSTSRKPYALEEACTVWEGVLIDQKEESTSTDMPLGTAIHNIEITLGKGGQLARAAGAVAKLIAKEGKSATLKLPSGEVRLISKNCSATVGQVGNVGVNQKSLGKAGSKCWLARRVIDQIRGRSYEETLMILELMPYRACYAILKLVYSAAANANHNKGLNETSLIISKAEVNEGTTVKKLKPRARGRGHHSLWFAQPKNYSKDLQEDQKIRDCIKNYVQNNMKISSNVEGIARIEIQKRIDLIQVIIYMGFPKLLIEDRTRRIEELQTHVQKELNCVNRKLNIAITRIANPYGHPNILAEFIAGQLKNRVSFRKAMKKAIELTEQAGTKGIQVQIAGRIDGKEIARVEWIREGRVPLQTIRAKIDYCSYAVRTIYGVLGIKIWIFVDEE